MMPPTMRAQGPTRRAFLPCFTKLLAVNVAIQSPLLQSDLRPAIAAETGYLSTESNPDGMSRGLNGDDNPTLPKFTTLPSGVRFIDIVQGKGEEAVDGRSVSLQWVLRRSNGYFVDASSEHNFDPFVYKVGDQKTAIKGFDEAVRGMRQGGKRRFTVPPELGYVQGTGDNKPGPMPPGFGLDPLATMVSHRPGSHPC